MTYCEAITFLMASRNELRAVAGFDRQVRVAKLFELAPPGHYVQLILIRHHESAR